MYTHTHVHVHACTHMHTHMHTCHTHTHMHTHMHTHAHMHTHTHTCTHTESVLPEVHYATVEVFLNRGLRVNGDIGPVLTAQLSSGITKTHVDERGWYGYHI